MTRGGKPGATRGRLLALIIVLAAFAVYFVVPTNVQCPAS